MKKELWSIKKNMFADRRGFSLVEVLLSITLFALLVITFVGALIYSQDSERLAGDRARATFLAEEGLEAVRNMRDGNHADLTDGNHGLSFSGNQWTFSGTTDVTDIFSRSISVTSVDADRKTIVANVTWKQNEQRNGSVTLSSLLTNWRKIRLTEAERLKVDVTGVAINPADHTQITGITIENTGASGDIAITQMQVSWTGGLGGTKISGIRMGGASVWSGSNASGSVEDVNPDFVLASGVGTYPIDNLTFSKDMTGATITIIFTMLDGTTKQTSFSPGDPPDTTPPGDITNLAASGATISSINLAWTAPGDDGTTGTASGYDIRYSTTAITSGNWGAATQVSGEPTPLVSGTNQSMTVSGLASATTYYFAMKTADEVPNTSGLSNVASLATLTPPQANYLVVNTTGVARSGNTITGITLQNSGSTNITVASMTVSWSGVAGNRRLTSININGGVAEWTGSVASGAVANITDTALIIGAAAVPMVLGYNNTIVGITVSIVFTMLDGSTKTISGIGPL